MSSRALILSVNGPAEQALVAALKSSGIQASVVTDPAVAARDATGHQLLVVDAADDKVVARLAHELRKAADAAGPAQLPLLAVAHGDDVELRVRLLEAGADDVLTYPFDPRELDALVDALLLRTESGSTATADGVPADIAVGPAARAHEVFVFAAAKGGVGTTTLAVNTALALAGASRAPVAIADLDFQRGQVATLLDVQGATTTADLARDEQALEDGNALRQAGAGHPGGVHVFVAPYRPDLGTSVDHQQATALVDALRRGFGQVVVDAGSVLDWRVLAEMGAADRIVLTVTPEIPSLRVLQGALELINEVEGVAERTVFVLNNLFARQSVSAEQIQEHLGVPIAVEIPHDGELFLSAANEGQPLILSAPRSPAAQAIRQLAAILRGQQAETRAAPQPKRKGIASLLKRG